MYQFPDYFLKMPVIISLGIHTRWIIIGPTTSPTPLTKEPGKLMSGVSWYARLAIISLMDISVSF